MKKPFVLVLVCAAAIALEAQDRAPSNDLITKQALRADLFFLASDNLQGRLTNTPGNRIAADWIAQRFERMGLAPGGPDGSYFQPYDLMVATLGPVERNTLALVGNTATVGMEYGKDFYPHRFSATGSAEGELAFAGFGITSPERQYDDFSGDVKGKIVLVLDHEPGERDPASPFDGIVTADAASAQRKAMFAQDRGAVGILFVSDVHNHPPSPPSSPAASAGQVPPSPPSSPAASAGQVPPSPPSSPAASAGQVPPSPPSSPAASAGQVPPSPPSSPAASSPAASAGQVPPSPPSSPAASAGQVPPSPAASASASPGGTGCVACRCYRCCRCAGCYRCWCQGCSGCPRCPRCPGTWPWRGTGAAWIA